MQKRRGYTLAFLVLLLLPFDASCLSQRKANEELKKRVADLESKLASLQERPIKDNWQRSKECAEQSERAAKRAGWVEGKRDGNITLMSWENHYSPKYEACYIRVTYMNNNIGKNENIPLFCYELFDAFEGKGLAMCTDSVGSMGAWCTIEGSTADFGNCLACGDFVRDRMNK